MCYYYFDGGCSLCKQSERAIEDSRADLNVRFLLRLADS